MNIPLLYIASGTAIIILIVTLMKLFTPQHNPEFIEIEEDGLEPILSLPEFITFYLIPQEPILGKELLQFFMDHGLQFSEKQKIFHSLSEDKHKKFCVATLSSPGIFDIHTMIKDTFSGLSFFMQPKATQKALDDFDALCQILFEAKETYNAQIQSEDKTTISLDQLRKIREQISQHHQQHHKA